MSHLIKCKKQHVDIVIKENPNLWVDVDNEWLDFNKEDYYLGNNLVCSVVSQKSYDEYQSYGWTTNYYIVPDYIERGLSDVE